MMKRGKEKTRIGILIAGLFAAGLAVSTPALAQVSTSTIKGRITQGTAAAQGGLAVTAVNKGNGTTYRTTTLADGSYVLSGLAPGAYEIRVAGPAGTGTTEVVTVQVGETAALDLALGEGQTMEKVTIIGSAQRADVRTSELGTNVSRKYIETLPQGTHNFLSSADLAPGVRFEQDAAGNTKIQSGSQNFDHVNVFVDGVSQKNQILRGGLTGQDSSRGNPFPQSAIAEYKIITQNYKAEYDQVSSAAITAITKSGTNEFHGDAYIDRTGTNWRARTPFEKAAENAGVPLPGSSKYEYGVSAGGPIKIDQVHYFFAYDGKNIDDSRNVIPRNRDRLPTGLGVVPAIDAAAGSTVDKFKEHLLFAKVDAQVTDDMRVSGSVKVRKEKDRIPENRDLSAPGNDKERSNDETRFDFKHEWARAAWLNEARIGYEDAVWNPKSASRDPLIRYKAADSLVTQRLTASQDVIFVGGSPDAQRRQQKGPFVSEDFTYTGVAQHVMKTGVKIKAAKYDLSGTAFGVEAVDTLVDRVTGTIFFDGTNCTGTNIINGGLQSDQCVIRRATPGARVSFSNNQIGVYFQDDWAVTPRLELNLGIRYDYETNMLNNDYVLPADRIAALFGPDTRTFVGQTAAPGQTYAQSLAKGGIDINQYIADGNSRKPFTRAFSPRLGFSFDAAGNKETVLFGGFGRSYDRTIANNALDEFQKNATPNQGEIWMIKNDFKMPYADQWSAGLRQAVGHWDVEISLAHIYAKNQFIWFVGNRDLNGGSYFESPIDPLFGGPPGFGTLILGDFAGKTKTDQLFVKVEKPYTTAAGWGLTIAYTYSDAQTTHREWNNDIFDFSFSKPGQGGWKPSTLVDKHRVVGAGVVDMPWGLTLGAKAVWASGFPRRGIYCPGGFPDPGTSKFGTCTTQELDNTSFRQIDLSLSKALTFGSQKFTVRADVFNIFNVINYSGRNDFIGVIPPTGAPVNSAGGDNVDLGKPNSIRGDPRTVRVMLGYSW